MAKKKKGELPSGNIRKRIFLGKDETGKKIYKSFTAPTRAEVDLMVAMWRMQHKEEKNLPRAVTVSEAAERYIDLKENVLSPATVRGYRTAQRCYIDTDSIGKRDIHVLDSTDVQLWVSSIAAKVSPKTVRNAYGLLISAVRMFRPGWTVDITLPQAKPAELYCPSDRDIKALLAVAMDTDLEIAILLAAFGPMRRSEICALESSDVKGNIITINKALVKNDYGEWIVKTPKTLSSRRKIIMPDFVIEKLKGIEGRIIKCPPNALSHRFERAMAIADCPRFRFHDLRHYGASIMHAIGIPDKYIMARGGWASDGVMKRVYQNVIQDEELKQTEKINAHFEGLLSS